ncbi:MAG: hypothetical protein OXI67_15280 [Candidatus Poribacteria bacterium]|nr:hypothetical protein [Candidatus Poribacteria bacterium]
MFKLKFKTTLIAAVIASLLLTCFVVQSNAASVTSMSIYSGDDWGSGTTVSVSLTTDEDIDFIDWHIDGEYSFTSTHGDTQSVYVYLGTYVGDIKGKKYDVMAVVSFEESSDADASDTFRVYKPIYTTAVDGNNGIPQHPDVDGYVVLYSHYFDGQNIVMSGSVNAYNGSNDSVHCSSWFRHTEYDANGFPTGWQRTTNGPSGPVEHGMSYDASSNSMTDYFVGGSIGPDDAYYLNAHIHLTTGQDDRHVDTGINRFTQDDNP